MTRCVACGAPKYAYTCFMSFVFDGPLCVLWKRSNLPQLTTTHHNSPQLTTTYHNPPQPLQYCPTLIKPVSSEQNQPISTWTRTET